MASSDRTRVAVLGAGGIGASAHLPAILALEHAELAGIADPDPARLAAAGHDFAVPPEQLFADPMELLNQVRPDVVSIATPPHTHEHLAIAAMEAGAWVYCEKPLTGSLASADRIAAAEKRTGQWCVTVSQFRYSDGSAEIQQRLRSRVWGAPLVGTALTEWFRPAGYWDAPWRGKADTEGGGATTTQAYHATDLMLWLMGQWESVSGFSATLNRPIEVEDSSVAAIRFASGALGTAVATVLSHRPTTRITIHAEHATIGLDTLYAPQLAEWSVTQHPTDDGVGGEGAWPPQPTGIPGHRCQLGLLIDDHRAGRTPELTTGESRDMLEFLTALYKSSATNTMVARRSIQPGDPYYDALCGVSP